MLHSFSGNMAAGSPSAAVRVCRDARPRDLRNLARVQLQSRFSPVLVFPRLDPTLLPIDRLALQD